MIAVWEPKEKLKESFHLLFENPQRVTFPRILRQRIP